MEILSCVLGFAKSMGLTIRLPGLRLRLKECPLADGGFSMTLKFPVLLTLMLQMVNVNCVLSTPL